MFDASQALCEWPPLPETVPPEDDIDGLVEYPPDCVAEPVRWSEYVPDGMLADLLTQPAHSPPTGIQPRRTTAVLISAVR